MFEIPVGAVRVTDEERREVAKRLRSKKLAEFGEPLARSVFRHVFRSLYPKQIYPVSNWVLRMPYALADFIDRPTCRIGYVPGSADRSCSACGVAFSTGTYQGGDHEEHEFMFCPNCGAEVVHDD